MAGFLPDDAEDPRSSIVSITVLSIKPVKLGRIFALASVESDIDGLVRFSMEFAHFAFSPSTR